MARGNSPVGRGWRWWAGGAAVVAGLAGGVAVLWVHAPDLYEPGADGRLQAIALTRTGVLTAGAALLALAGVAANLLENRRATNLTHTRELAEQLADRYTAAITQLGSDTLDVRLGGLYALEQIAVDSEAHHRTVVEVLSAFVREHTTPGRPGTARRSRHPAALPTPADHATGTAARHTPAGLDTDIQAALTVLGRLPDRAGVPRADLTGAHLSGARLGGANLSGAELFRADLSGARLGGANLSGAELFGANLSGAELFGADLSGAGLGGADLSGAVLFRADLSGARLVGANLSGAELFRADLSGAELFEANLSGAGLGGADLSGAGGLTQERLDAARGDGWTVLPEGLARPASWSEPDGGHPDS